MDNKFYGQRQRLRTALHINAWNEIEALHGFDNVTGLAQTFYSLPDALTLELYRRAEEADEAS